MPLRQGKTLLLFTVRCVISLVFSLFLVPRSPLGEEGFTAFLGTRREGGLVADINHAPNDIIDGRYRLVERLGSGAYANVWLAWNTRLRFWQAIKILQLPSSDVRRRFRIEALAAAELANSPDPRHKFIARVTDVSDEDAPVQWMAMEYLSEGDLFNRLDRYTPSMHQALVTARDICLGVSLAHDRKPSPIIHRDLKPQNILLDKDYGVKVTDFGIASVLHVMDEHGGNAVAGATRVGQTMGTTGWSAPEQLKDASQQDVRSDVFSLGTIVAALTVDFYPGEKGERLLHLPRVQDEVLREAPDAIRTIIVTACNVDPELRYPTVASMIAAINDAIPAFSKEEVPWVLREGKTVAERSATPAPPKTPVGVTMFPGVEEPLPEIEVEPEAIPSPFKPRHLLLFGLFIGAIATVSCGIHYWPHRQDVISPIETPVNVPVEAPKEVPIEPPPKPIAVPVPIIEVKPKVDEVKSKVEVKPKAEPKPPVIITTPSVTLLHLPSSVHPGETVTVSARLAVPKDQTVASVTLRYQGQTGGAWQHTTMTVDGTTAKASFTASPSLGTSMTVKVDLRLTSDPGTPVKSNEATVAISSN